MEKSEKIIIAHVTAVRESQPDDNEKYFLILWNIGFDKPTVEVFKTREAREVYYQLHFNVPDMPDYEKPEKRDVSGSQLEPIIKKTYHPQFH